MRSPFLNPGIVLTSALLFSIQLCGQDLPESYITAQIKPYQQWLDATHLGQFLMLDTLKQAPGEKVVLYLHIDGFKNWLKLSKFVDSTTGDNLSALLFDRLTFQLDRTEGEIEIDAGISIVHITMINGILHTDAKRTQSLGPASVDYNISGLSNLDNTWSFNSNQSKSRLRDRIKDFFYTYFMKYKATFEKYSFQDLSQDDSVLVLEISNIKNAVLKEGYFEHLDLYIKLSAQGNSTKGTYTMWGKYGSGIIWAPHDARYNPMVPDYQQEVDHFNETIHHHIYTLIN
jgi:hypothetical protein